MRRRRSSWESSYLSVNWSEPINWNHRLNEGLVAWMLVTPSSSYGLTLRNLVNPARHLTGVNTEQTDWDTPTGSLRQGGWGCINLGGTNEAFEVASALVTAAPVTLSTWFRTSSATLQQCLVLVNDGDTGANWFLIEAAGNIAVDPVRAQAQQTSAGETFATTTTGYAVNTWHHACGSFAAINSRTAYIDGGSAGSDATSHTPVNLARTGLGVFRVVGDYYSPITGQLDCIRVHNRALSADEVLEEYELTRNYSVGLLNRRRRPTYFVPTVTPPGGNRRRRVLLTRAA